VNKTTSVPRDPRYYAPRWLREKIGLPRITGSRTGHAVLAGLLRFQLEGAVSNALRHPLDPEVMHEPDYPNELEPRSALRSITVRFAAAVGVSALVALFFVVIVPASRQADGETSGAYGIVQSIKTALFQPSETDNTPPPATSPATSEFQALLASAQASKPAPQGQSGQLLNQFMQWQQKPAPTAP